MACAADEHVREPKRHRCRLCTAARRNSPAGDHSRLAEHADHDFVDLHALGTIPRSFAHLKAWVFRITFPVMWITDHSSASIAPQAEQSPFCQVAANQPPSGQIMLVGIPACNQVR